MRKIIIDVQYTTVRVAVVDDNNLQEFFCEDNSASTVGNIYKGRVVNVLDGLQAAFVDIGLNKNAYLQYGDIAIDTANTVGVVDNVTYQQLDLRIGDELLVQVTKDEVNSKGARVTTNISLAGKYSVLLPLTSYIGISRKIEDVDERQRLVNIFTSINHLKMGMIARTAADNVSKKAIREDYEVLTNTWKTINSKYASARIGQAIFCEQSLIIRTLRDIVGSDTSEIVINNKTIATEVKQMLSPMNLNCEIIEFDSNVDIFAKYQLATRINTIMSRKVDLSNGSYIIIDKTEALTIIDVNSGKYIATALEETIFNTNMLACEEIARQLSFRNIGGIVIVDFIDMHLEGHRSQVVDKLTNLFKHDRVKTTVVGMTGLGLVEITRKKSRNDISNVIKQVCPYCNGEGYVSSCDLIVSKIRYDIISTFNISNINAMIVTVHPSVSDCMFSAVQLPQDMQALFDDKLIYIVADINCHIEYYDIKTFNTTVLTLPSNAKLLY